MGGSLTQSARFIYFVLQSYLPMTPTHPLTSATARIVGALFLAATAAAAACSGPTLTIGIGQNIHHDDFEYSVQAVEKLARIGDRTASGVFYVVTFQVENRAKRVDHPWDNSLAYVCDEQGRQFDNDPDAQRQLNRTSAFNYHDRYLTPPGTAETTKFVFDVPRDVTEPYLRVRGETLMGDVFDAGRFRRTRVRLF